MVLHEKEKFRIKTILQTGPGQAFRRLGLRLVDKR